MFAKLLIRHQKRVKRWKARFGLSEYEVFWMGFGEGLIIGGILIFFLLQIISLCNYEKEYSLLESPKTILYCIRKDIS